MATRTKAELITKLAERLPANDTGAIVPDVHRAMLTDLLDSAPIGIAGSPALPGVAWIDGAGWQAVSDTTVQFMVVTRTDDFGVLGRAIRQALQAGGTRVYLPGIPAYVSQRLSSWVVISEQVSSTNGVLDELWPPGSSPPFFWMVSPTRWQWLARTRIDAWTLASGISGATRFDDADRNPSAVGYTVEIDHVPYLVGRFLTGLARPLGDPANPNQASLRFKWRYDSPAEATPTVTQVL